MIGPLFTRFIRRHSSTILITIGFPSVDALERTLPAQGLATDETKGFHGRCKTLTRKGASNGRGCS